MRKELVTLNDVVLDGFSVGVYEISLTDRRIISVPSQIGCPVACTFCVSKETPLVRNFKSHEVIFLIKQCLEKSPPDGRPIEISFTGEGEPIMNWKELGIACNHLTKITRDINLVRYCFSGIGATKFLAKISSGGLPMRLQFSLHAARQSVRDTIIPKSIPLLDIVDSLIRFENKFELIKLNVVLINGVNDSNLDLKALISFGKINWPILLNPQLSSDGTHIGDMVGYFHEQLTQHGRIVFKYNKIGESIGENNIYNKLTARKLI